MKSKLLANITPGEILEEEFFKPMAITQYRLAKDLGVASLEQNFQPSAARAIGIFEQECVTPLVPLLADGAAVTIQVD